MTDNVIECYGVSKSYARSQRPALSGVDLAVPLGQILALVGESGSGKTTLLRITAGLERPDDGEVRINGRVVSNGSIWVAPERRAVGVVFQEGALFPHRTVAGNVRYGLTEKSRAKQDATVAEMLSLVDLSGYEKRYPHELSGGERQRVALARALAPKPAVMLLDEPFSSLDATLRQALRDDVCRILKELKTTAILVVHDPEDALIAGDRIAILKAGYIQQVATPHDVYHRPGNEYCARLFGAANLVSLDGLGPQWARPEQFQLVDAEREGTIPVKVVRTRDAGKHLEIVVQPCADPAVEWLIRDNSGNAVQPGDQIWAVWKLPLGR